MVSKVFEKLVNSIVHYIEKCFFSWFPYFRSFWSITYLLTVVSDRIISPWYIQGFWGSLVCCFLFSVTDSFWWFWIGYRHKNMLLMLAFLKGPFLVLHYSYYKLMTFLMLLSVILLYLLIILLSTLNLIRHLICGNNQNWFLNLNLIYETL